MNGEVYFSNVLSIGDLYLYKILNTFEDENILFICNDRYDNLYLCVCYEFRYKLEWIICKTNDNIVQQMIDNLIDIHSVFTISEESYIKILFENDRETSVIIQKEKCNRNFLPTPGVYYKPDNKYNHITTESFEHIVNYQEYFNYNIELGYSKDEYFVLNMSLLNRELLVDYDLDIISNEQSKSVSCNLNDAA